MAAGNVIGGLVAAMVSRRTSSLAAFKKLYLFWFIFSLPLVYLSRLVHDDSYSCHEFDGWRLTSFLFGN